MVIKLDNNGGIEFYSFNSENYYNINEISILIPKSVVKNTDEITTYIVNLKNTVDSDESANFNLIIENYEYDNSPNYYQCKLKPSATVLFSEGEYKFTMNSGSKSTFSIGATNTTIKLKAYQYTKPNSVLIDISDSAEMYYIDKNRTNLEITLPRIQNNNIDITSCDVVVKIISQAGEKSIKYINAKYIENEEVTYSYTFDNNDIFAICFLNPTFDIILESSLYSIRYSTDEEGNATDVLEFVEITSENDSLYFKEFKRWMKSREFYLLEGNFELRDLENAITITKRSILMSENDNYIVKNDHNSQLITFKLDRYQDAIDISKKNIYIKFINAQGNGYLSKAVNLITNEDFVYFSWLITSNVTKESGNVQFNIEIMGENADQDNWYVWQTQPATINVLDTISLEYESAFEEDDIAKTLPNWYVNLLSRINNISIKPGGSTTIIEGEESSKWEYLE